MIQVMPAGLGGGSRAYPRPRHVAVRRRGGNGSAPTTLTQDFPGWIGLWGDPYAAGFEPTDTGGVYKWADTSGCGNHVWAQDTVAAAPWDGGVSAKPTTAVVDGHIVPLFDGSNDSLTGWFTGTPTGENFMGRSELWDAPFWSATNAVGTAGPVPHAATGATESTTLTDASANNVHYADATYPTNVIAGQIYVLQFCVQKSAGNDWIGISDDVAWLQWFNIASGAVGTSSGAQILDKSITATGDWWRCRIRFLATSGAKMRMYMAPADNATTYTTNGSAFHTTAWQLNPSREAAWPTRPYVKTTSERLLNAVHANCTIVTVADSNSTGPRAIFEITGNTLANSVGPRCGTDTGLFHTQGVKAQGTDQNYARAPGNLDCHVIVANPGANSMKIYRNGVEVLSTTCTTWNKPATAVRIARLFGDLWQLSGAICTVGYRTTPEDAAFALAVTNKLRAAPAFPSISV